jgi:hypothetical protein
MTRVSAWFVRVSLCHLIGGFAIGALMLANKGLVFAVWPWSLRGAHIEMLIMGWVVQMVMGVAIWIFPRFGMRGTSSGGGVTAWLAFGFLNSGVLLVCAGGPGLASGRLLEIGAAASFAVHLWRRVSPSGIAAL